MYVLTYFLYKTYVFPICIIYMCIYVYVRYMLDMCLYYEYDSTNMFFLFIRYISYVLLENRIVELLIQVRSNALHEY